MKPQSPFYCLLLLMPLTAQAQTDPAVKKGVNNTQIVVSANEGARTFHTRWGYAPAVRAGDYIHMSGVIAGRDSSEGTDAEAFKQGLRRAFSSLRDNLKALDASLEDVIKIHTYHVFDSRHFDGDKVAHMEAVREVKVEFMGDATPAWTAIGVSELFTDTGLVEIELTVYAPVGKRGRP